MAEARIPEQIPWAQHVKVTHQSDLSIDLELSSGQKADIWHKDFEWFGSFDSRKDITSYMKLDERLTKDIQDHFEEFVERQDRYVNFKEKITDWLKHGLVSKPVPRGPKEWRPAPGGRQKREKPWKFGQYGYANTYNEDNAYYLGDVFEFAHFETDEGEDGAVILWQRGGDPRGNYGLPEVWLGDFEAFFDSQYEHDPWSYETFLHWNSVFENGFMWAFEKLGIFDDGGEKIERLDDRHVQQVLKAIEKEPSILLPESVQKILERFDDFPKQIQKAVQWLMRNHRRDLEKALGQKLLWGDLYVE